jgi:hypothetical protein
MGDQLRTVCQAGQESAGQAAYPQCMLVLLLALMGPAAPDECLDAQSLLGGATWKPQLTAGAGSRSSKSPKSAGTMVVQLMD